MTLELLGAMAAKMRRLCQFVDDTLFLTLPVRLARRLVELAERFGRETEGGLRVEMRLTQAELGALVGATRESVNKQLREWEEQEILQMRNGQLVIQRRDRLASVANGIPD